MDTLPPRPERLTLDALIDAALAAGAEIMAVYAGDFAVIEKPDATPVTEADLRAEAVILARLEAIAPGVPVVAEEAAAAGIVPEIADRFFLVDPLDGSKEFIARNGEFTVNIALVEHGVPVAGVVYAPALGTIWWGEAGRGAFAATTAGGGMSAPRAIACGPCAPDGMRVVGSRSHAGSAEADYLKTIPVAAVVTAGSSLKFCLLAEGRADLYPRFGRTMEWDTAAGDAILRAAGGTVETLDSRPLAYGKRNQQGETDFANPHFIARAGRG